MAEQVGPPICTFNGDPALAADAERFIQTTLARPDIMRQALSAVRITSRGDFLYGVPGERDVTVDPVLTECIGAVATVLKNGADLYFRYDSDTRQAMRKNPTLRDLWSKKRDAPQGYGENVTAAQLRIGRLSAFAGRVADPYGMNAQLSSAFRTEIRAA